MGNPETAQVYPVATGPQMDSAPPPYTVVGGAPVAVEMQPVYAAYPQQQAYGQPTVVQAHVVQQPTQATVIISASVKHVDQDKPYLEYCPRCQVGCFIEMLGLTTKIKFHRRIAIYIKFN